MRVGLIFPHQIFQDHPVLPGVDLVVLVEEPLLFTQYEFHSHKRVLHRASMKSYEHELRLRGYATRYVDSLQLSQAKDLAVQLKAWGSTSVRFVDVCDDWLFRKLKRILFDASIDFEVLDDPHFLTPWTEFDRYGQTRDRWFFANFYESQRKRLRLLVDEQLRPLGGRWSFDQENRKKLPRDEKLPTVSFPKPSRFVREAVEYVQRVFPKAPGDPTQFAYPTTAQQANDWLNEFIDTRLEKFGDYEDAMHDRSAILYHSVLTPTLNIGLLSPMSVVDAALNRASELPLNTVEGFVRQVIGWREYVRGVYRHFGTKQRTLNFWGHQHPIPKAFYTATTCVEPVDSVLNRVIEIGYCHHIERLMILGNFMLLCEIHPDAVYQWFMEMFIDSYDWVMVPNVYGMSQYADGGLITTKPYISGSNYVRKMSNYPSGKWCEIWDGLYWRFIDKHRKFFKSNPRLSVMAAQCERMGDRLKQHHVVADRYLESLFQG